MPHASFPPEARLVLLTAGGTAVDREIAELSASDLEWGRVWWYAEAERVVPAVWHRLRSIPGIAIPIAAAAQLQKSAMVAEFKLLCLKQRLDATVDALTAAGVDNVLLKGAALASTLYPSFTARPMVDLDVLIRAEQVERAHAALLGAGWAWSPDERLEEFYRGHHHLPALVDRQSTGAKLELHTALFHDGHPFRLPTERIWEHARVVRAGGRVFRVPDVHHQLLHVCLHYSWSHALGEGAWRAFRDVDVLIGSGDVQWPAFISLARESRGATCCYWTLRLARTLAGIAVPDDVTSALAPPHRESVLRRLERHFIVNLLTPSGNCPSVRVVKAMWRLAILPGRSGHGDARPWDRSHLFVPPVAAVPSAGVRKIAHHLAHLRNWASYVRFVLGVTPR